MGVEVIHGYRWSNGFPRYMAENGAHIDAVLLSRPHIAPAYIDDIRKHSKARIVYYGHDLHFRRLLQEYELTGKEELLAASNSVEAQERVAWAGADIVLYPSADEVHALSQIAPKVPALAVPAYSFEDFNAWPGPGERNGILFVAGFAHPPNVDAAIWLREEVMPRVHAVRPDAMLHLVGSNPTEAVRALADDRTLVTGWVSDEALACFYGTMRVAVVPLRFGAGIKSKVVEALQQGLPLVTTPVGAQGLAGIETAACVAAEAVDLAKGILRLLEDDAEWTRCSAAGADFAAAQFSTGAMRDALAEAFGLRADEPA